MVTTIRMEYDHLLKSPHFIKNDDPSVPTILCSINRCYFYNTVCDTRLGVNIMAKVTYEFIYGIMPLGPTYVQLQLADQSFCFVDGIAKNIPIQIEDHYVPTDFLVVDMGEEYDPSIIIGRPFLNYIKAIIYIGTGEVHFQFRSDKVRLHYNSNYINEEDPKNNRTRRRRNTCHQKKKNVVDGWADYEGEVSRYEDWYPNEENIVKEEESAEEEIVIPDTLSSKSPLPTMQLWKPKENSEINPRQDIASMAPSDAPLDQWANKKVLFGGLKITKHRAKR